MPIWLDLFLTFFKIGAFTFGGGYAMLSIITDNCVERKRWITQDDMMNITVIARGAEMWQSASPKRKEGAAVQPPPGEKCYLGSVEPL